MAAQVGIRRFASLFPELGFNTLEIELDPEIKKGSYPNSLEGILELYAKGEHTSPALTLLFSDTRMTELRSQINLFHSFPPVLIARGISTLIAQTYVESYSTSALALIGGQSLIPQQIRPPESYMSIAFPTSRNLPTYDPPNFTYEPRFPILSIEAAAEDQENEVLFREMIHFRGEELDVMKDPGLLDEMAIYHSIRSWLDRVGI